MRVLRNQFDLIKDSWTRPDKPDYIVMEIRAVTKVTESKKTKLLPFVLKVLLPPWEEHPCQDPQTFG
jgi:hypothetical protein